MSMRRLPTATAVLVALACVAGVVGSSAAAAAPTVATAPAAPAAQPAAAAPAVTPTATAVGTPPGNFAVLPGTYFSFPNTSTAARYNIRNRVLLTINSVWGGPRGALGQPVPGNGSIRIATWSFDDWGVAKALVAAKNRGVSVQVVAAALRNSDNGPWNYLQRYLGIYRYVPGHPETAETTSFARQCRGSCRGVGGTPHSKFFLFDNVGAGHHRSIVMQSSMNLTNFAVVGQWNQAQVLWGSPYWSHHMGIFRQMRVGAAVYPSYRRYTYGNVDDIFFPKRGTTAATDPVMEALNKVRCAGAASGGTNGRTKIRIIQYAIYDDRGLWLARKLRYLRSAGCDVAIIYSLMTRPVLDILRGVPKRQSVIKNSRGEIVKYNHSKWMTITGNWDNNPRAYLSFSGSANWSNAAFADDEQMQQILSYTIARNFLLNFTATWNQHTSRAPSYARMMVNGRMTTTTVPEDAAFGQGAYKYMTPNG
jgi:hypothetical protein